MLSAAGSAYYPDFLIVSGPAEHRLYEADASLIVEILSASTQDHDRREKAMAFSSLTTLRHYLLIDPERTSVEVAQLTDGQWEWKKYGPGSIVVTAYGGSTSTSCMPPWTLKRRPDDPPDSGSREGLMSCGS